MRRVSLIALVSVVALFLGGCPGNEGEETGGESTPSPTPVAVRRTPTPSPSPSAAPFANPTAPQQPGNPVAVTGLLQTLPPEARVNQIPKGRSDPFGTIPVQPQVVVPPNAAGGGGGPTAVRPVPVLPQLPPPARANTGTGGNRPGTTGATTRRNQPSPQRQATSPGGGNATRTNQRTPQPQARPAAPRTPSPSPAATPPPPPLVPELPEIPQPTLARSVEVTGVVDVGGVPKAIVKVPNEPSRYVQPGQRLLNGQVLVKRIEMNRGPEPVVILEQFGVEVSKRVGEPAEGQAGGPTAFVPPPPPNPVPVPQV
ncbi:MAG: hypothetical protein LDL41_14100 [Coleofasciculus sp. S288]|nr:hypothetical protein [Coleofasciculus sp. S288]